MAHTQELFRMVLSDKVSSFCNDDIAEEDSDWHCRTYVKHAMIGEYGIVKIVINVCI
jgi:hypothetical protein